MLVSAARAFESRENVCFQVGRRGLTHDCQKEPTETTDMQRVVDFSQVHRHRPASISECKQSSDTAAGMKSIALVVSSETPPSRPVLV